MDKARADRPERQTAVVAVKLARYSVDVAALGETRLPDVEQITEQGGGYTFFWSGYSSEERREAGVGFAVKTLIVPKLTSLPKGVNDRLMTLQLPLGKSKSATIINAYAPTNSMANPEELKDKL